MHSYTRKKKQTTGGSRAKEGECRLKRASCSDRAMAEYQSIPPKFFGPSCGANIQLDRDSKRAEWKFFKSKGLAFSGFSMFDNRVHEVIFDGSGHARIGLTQTDPDHISDLQEAVKTNKIVFVSDVRFHKRECLVGIVKTVRGNNCKFETRFRDNDPQVKDLVAGSDVWIVFFLKFGKFTVQIKDKNRHDALKFHRKRDENVNISNDMLTMNLIYPIPLAFACLENTIEQGNSIKFSVKHTEEEKKPNSFHFCVGVSTKRALIPESLDFEPFLSDRIEKDSCLGYFTVCVSRGGKLHIHKKDSCIYTKSISHLVDLSVPLYVCFEIFRVRVELLETNHCHHDSDAMEHVEGSGENEEFPYSDMMEVRGIMQDILRTKTVTAADKNKIQSLTPGLADYVNHSSIVSRGEERDGYLTPVHNEGMSSVIRLMETIRGEVADRIDHLTEQVRQIIPIVEKLLKNHEQTTNMSGRNFQSHLQSTCADFIRSVDTFPLCDYLLQYGIITQAQYDKLREESKRCKEEANRDLFSVLMKREYNSEEIRRIEQAFKETQQEHLLPRKQ